jgi:hypothetical protein
MNTHSFPLMNPSLPSSVPAHWILVGSITLTRTHQFTNHTDFAAWMSFVECQPQTVPLYIADRMWIVARFTGVQTGNTFPAADTHGKAQIGLPDGASIQWRLEDSPASYDNSELAGAFTWDLLPEWEYAATGGIYSTTGKPMMKLRKVASPSPAKIAKERAAGLANGKIDAAESTKSILTLDNERKAAIGIKSESPLVRAYWEGWLEGWSVPSPAAPTLTPEAAYEADRLAHPLHHDGTARALWADLSDIARESWRRNPTPRNWAPAAPCPSPSHLPLVPPVGVTDLDAEDHALIEKGWQKIKASVPAPVSPSLPAPSYAIIVYDAEYPTGWRVHSTNQTKKDAEWDATGMNAVVEKSFRHPETGIYAIVVSNKVAAAHEIRPPAENGSTPSVSVEDKLDYIRSLASLHNEDGDFRFPSELSCYKIQQLALELKSPFSALKAEVARLTEVLKEALPILEGDLQKTHEIAHLVPEVYAKKAARVLRIQDAIALVKGDAK